MSRSSLGRFRSPSLWRRTCTCNSELRMKNYEWGALAGNVSADRAGISADRMYHTGLRGEDLRESARAAGDMVYGGSSVVFDGAKIRKIGVGYCSSNWKYFQYLFSAVCLNKKKAFHSARSLS